MVNSLIKMSQAAMNYTIPSLIGRTEGAGCALARSDDWGSNMAG